MTDNVFLALGSNIEPRLGRLQAALQEIQKLGDVQNVSPVYQTAPYGDVNQPDFLNCALKMSTELEPEALLTELKKIESRLGRRERRRWGPREIDVDIIFYGSRIVEKQGLRIPHGDYRNRVFVLQPLADISPDFVPPGGTETLKELLSEKESENSCALLATEWIGDGTEF